MGIPADNLSHRFLCLKTSRVLSEFSKAQVNAVPTNGLSALSGELEIPTGRASLSLPGLEASGPSGVPAGPLPGQASSETQDGGRKPQPPPLAPGALGLPQVVTAEAVPSASVLGPQLPSPMRETATRAVRPGSGQQEPPEDDGAKRSPRVSSPTSPVSDVSFSGGGLGEASQSWCRGVPSSHPKRPPPCLH